MTNTIITQSAGSDFSSTYIDSCSSSSTVSTQDTVIFKGHTVVQTIPEDTFPHIKQAVTSLQKVLHSNLENINRSEIIRDIITVVNNPILPEDLHIAFKSEMEEEQKEQARSTMCWHKKLDVLIEQYQKQQNEGDIKTKWFHRFTRNPFRSKKTSRISQICKDMKNYLSAELYKSIHKHYKEGASKNKVENLSEAIRKNGNDAVVYAFKKVIEGENTSPHIECIKLGEHEKGYATIRRTMSRRKILPQQAYTQQHSFDSTQASSNFWANDYRRQVGSTSFELQISSSYDLPCDKEGDQKSISQGIFQTNFQKRPWSHNTAHDINSSKNDNYPSDGSSFSTDSTETCVLMSRWQEWYSKGTN